MIFWPDTLNNHLLPATALAAVEVLDVAGCQAHTNEQHRLLVGMGLVMLLILLDRLIRKRLMRA